MTNLQPQTLETKITNLTEMMMGAFSRKAKKELKMLIQDDLELIAEFKQELTRKENNRWQEHTGDEYESLLLGYDEEKTDELLSAVRAKGELFQYELGKQYITDYHTYLCAGNKVELKQDKADDLYKKLAPYGAQSNWIIDNYRMYIGDDYYKNDPVTPTGKLIDLIRIAGRNGMTSMTIGQDFLEKISDLDSANLIQIIEAAGEAGVKKFNLGMNYLKKIYDIDSGKLIEMIVAAGTSGIKHIMLGASYLQNMPDLDSDGLLEMFRAGGEGGLKSIDIGVSSIDDIPGMTSNKLIELVKVAGSNGLKSIAWGQSNLQRMSDMDKNKLIELLAVTGANGITSMCLGHTAIVDEKRTDGIIQTGIKGMNGVNVEDRYRKVYKKYGVKLFRTGPF